MTIETQPTGLQFHPPTQRELPLYTPAAPTREFLPMPEPSRMAFDEYIELRRQAAECVKPEGEELQAIQSDVESYFRTNTPEMDDPGTRSQYETYSPLAVQAKIGGLVSFLRKYHLDKIGIAELDATEKFLTSAFHMYDAREKGEQLSDRDGSFAFVVPMRMSRKHPMYGHEIEPLIPALRYVPNTLRAWMMRGLPPFVADTYQVDEQGKRGYLVCVPSVTEDMKDDLSTESAGEFIHAGRKVVNDGVDFAVNRLGCRVAGLGAILPSITNYGKSVRDRFGDQIIVTTGHGGTAHLITATIDKLRESQEKSKRIGVLGVGAIGAAAAGIIADTYPEGTRLTVFDTAVNKSERLKRAYPDHVTIADSIAAVIRNSDVIISAVTDVIDTDKEGITDMSGIDIVDDSQPASFDPEQVAALGGRVAWVIGSGGIQREGYTYGTMADGKRDLFGCEAEAWAIYKALIDMEKEERIPSGMAFEVASNLAVTTHVTAQKTAIIGKLFDIMRVVPSHPQAFGKHLSISL